MNISAQQLLSELPGPIQALVFGQEIPGMDTEAGRRVSAAWEQAGAELGTLVQRIEAEISALPAAARENLGERIAASAQSLGAATAGSGEFCRSIGRHAERSTADTDKELYTMYAFGAMTVYQLMLAGGWHPIRALQVLSAARAKHLARFAAFVSGRAGAGAAAAAERAGLLATQAGGFALLTAGVDAGVQAGQMIGILDGHRETMDWRSVATAGVAGAGAGLGGALGGRLAQAVLPGSVPELLGRAVVAGTAGVSGVVGGAAAAAAMTGEFHLPLSALFSGAAVGMASARANSRAHSDSGSHAELTEVGRFQEIPGPDGVDRLGHTAGQEATARLRDPARESGSPVDFVGAEQGTGAGVGEADAVAALRTGESSGAGGGEPVNRPESAVRARHQDGGAAEIPSAHPGESNPAVPGEGSGPVAHGAAADSAVAHGPATDGPVARGLAADGAVAHGLAVDGPPAHGVSADGPPAHGAAAGGPAAHGAATDRSAGDGAAADGAAGPTHGSGGGDTAETALYRRINELREQDLAETRASAGGEAMHSGSAQAAKPETTASFGDTSSVTDAAAPHADAGEINRRVRERDEARAELAQMLDVSPQEVRWWGRDALEQALGEVDAWLGSLGEHGWARMDPVVREGVLSDLGPRVAERARVIAEENRASSPVRQWLGPSGSAGARAEVSSGQQWTAVRRVAAADGATEVSGLLDGVRRYGDADARVGAADRRAADGVSDPGHARYAVVSAGTGVPPGGDVDVGSADRNAVTTPIPGDADQPIVAARPVGASSQSTPELGGATPQPTSEAGRASSRPTSEVGSTGAGDSDAALTDQTRDFGAKAGADAVAKVRKMEFKVLQQESARAQSDLAKWLGLSDTEFFGMKPSQLRAAVEEWVGRAERMPAQWQDAARPHLGAMVGGEVRRAMAAEDALSPDGLRASAAVPADLQGRLTNAAGADAAGIVQRWTQAQTTIEHFVANPRLVLRLDLNDGITPHTAPRMDALDQTQVLRERELAETGQNGGESAFTPEVADALGRSGLVLSDPASPVRDSGGASADSPESVDAVERARALRERELAEMGQGRRGGEPALSAEVADILTRSGLALSAPAVSGRDGVPSPITSPESVDPIERARVLSERELAETGQAQRTGESALSAEITGILARSGLAWGEPTVPGPGGSPQDGRGAPGSFTGMRASDEIDGSGRYSAQRATAAPPADDAGGGSSKVAVAERDSVILPAAAPDPVVVEALEQFRVLRERDLAETQQARSENDPAAAPLVVVHDPALTTSAHDASVAEPGDPAPRRDSAGEVSDPPEPAASTNTSGENAGGHRAGPEAHPADAATGHGSRPAVDQARDPAQARSSPGRSPAPDAAVSLSPHVETVGSIASEPTATGTTATDPAADSTTTTATTAVGATAAGAGSAATAAGATDTTAGATEPGAGSAATAADASTTDVSSADADTDTPAAAAGAIDMGAASTPAAAAATDANATAAGATSAAAEVAAPHNDSSASGNAHASDPVAQLAAQTSPNRSAPNPQDLAQQHAAASAQAAEFLHVSPQELRLWGPRLVEQVIDQFEARSAAMGPGWWDGLDPMVRVGLLADLGEMFGRQLRDLATAHREGAAVMGWLRDAGLEPDGTAPPPGSRLAELHRLAAAENPSSPVHQLIDALGRYLSTAAMVEEMPTAPDRLPPPDLPDVSEPPPVSPPRPEAVPRQSLGESWWFSSPLRPAWIRLGLRRGELARKLAGEHGVSVDPWALCPDSAEISQLRTRFAEATAELAGMLGVPTDELTTGRIEEVAARPASDDAAEQLIGRARSWLLMAELIEAAEGFNGLSALARTAAGRGGADQGWLDRIVRMSPKELSSRWQALRAIPTGSARPPGISSRTSLPFQVSRGRAEPTAVSAPQHQLPVGLWQSPEIVADEDRRRTAPPRPLAPVAGPDGRGDFRGRDVPRAPEPINCAPLVVDYLIEENGSEAVARAVVENPLVPDESLGGTGPLPLQTVLGAARWESFASWDELATRLYAMAPGAAAYVVTESEDARQELGKGHAQLIFHDRAQPGVIKRRDPLVAGGAKRLVYRAELPSSVRIFAVIYDEHGVVQSVPADSPTATETGPAVHQATLGNGVEPIPSQDNLFPDITRVLDRLPATPRKYHELVDRARQLAADHPDVCELRPVLDEAGRPILSRRGIPMQQFVVYPRGGPSAAAADGADGSSAPHLYYGLVHSNEFWSSGTIEGLMDFFVSEPGPNTRKRVFLLGLDPDGAMLAERHAAVFPLTLEWAIRTFYRPDGAEQPEYDFGSTRTMPETHALMAVIREHLPEVMFSLHNMDIASPWVGTTSDLPGLGEVVNAASRLVRIPSGGPTVDVGEATKLAEGLYLYPEIYQWRKIADYARAHGAARSAVLVLESPMWRAVRFPEITPAEAADIAERRLAQVDDLAAKLPQTPASEVYRPVRMFIEDARRHVEFWRAEPDMATDPLWSRILPVRAVGLLWQYANQLLVDNPADPTLAVVERELDQLLTSWVQEVERIYQVTPGSYRDAVGFQMRVCLAAGSDDHPDVNISPDPVSNSELAGHLVARRDDLVRRARDASGWLTQQFAVTTEVRNWIEAAITRSVQELTPSSADDPPWQQRDNLVGQERELWDEVTALGPAAPDDLIVRSARFTKARADIDHRQQLITRSADLDRQLGEIGELIDKLEYVSDEDRFGELDTTARDLIAELERRRKAIEGNPAEDDSDQTDASAEAAEENAAEQHSADAIELRRWAAGLDSATARERMDEHQTRATAQLQTFRRGEPPPIGEMIRTGRALNALVEEQSRRFRDAMPEMPASRPAQAELVATVQAAMARLSELEGLHAASGVVVELVGALPAGAGIRPLPLESGYLEFLLSFPSHLARTREALSGLASAQTFDSLWDEKLPAALRHVADISRYFEARLLPDGTNWPEQVDRYMAERVDSDFSPALVSALRAASASAQSGSDDVFAAESLLQQLSTAAGYYLTRTRDVKTALALIRRLGAALEPAADRLGPSHPAVQAARIVGKLHTELTDSLADKPDYAIPEIMRARGLDALGPDPVERSVIDATARSLRRHHQIGALGELGADISAELLSAATMRIERSNAELRRLASAVGVEPSRLAPGSPELAEQIAEFDSTATELVRVLADTARGPDVLSENPTYRRDRHQLELSLAGLILAPGGPMRVARVVDRIERGLRLVDSDDWGRLNGEAAAVGWEWLPEWIVRGVLLDAEPQADLTDDPAELARAGRRTAHDAEVADLLGLADPIPESDGEYRVGTDPLAELRLLGESVPHSTTAGRVIDTVISYLEAGQLVGLPGRLVGDGMEVARLRGEEIRRELHRFDTGQAEPSTRLAELEVEYAKCRQRYHWLLLQSVAAPFGIAVAHLSPAELMRRVEALRTASHRPPGGLAELIAAYDDHVAASADLQALSGPAGVAPTQRPESTWQGEASATGLSRFADVPATGSSRSTDLVDGGRSASVDPSETAKADAGTQVAGPPVGIGEHGGPLAEHGVVVGAAAVEQALGSRPPGEQDIVELSVPAWLYRNLVDEGWNAVSVDEQDRSRTLSADREVSDWSRRQVRFPVLEQGPVRVSVGWHGVVSHEDLLRRSWRPSQEGVRYAGLPDIYAWSQERDLREDVVSTEWIKGYLLDPERSPLPATVIARTRDEVTDILRSRLPESRIEEPQVRRGIRLAAEAIFISRTLYGDPDIGRANHLYNDAFEKREYWIAAFYHNGIGITDDLRGILDNGLRQGADLGEIMLAIVSDAWSDVVYGGGRRSDNPQGYDELKSAEMLHRIASHPVHGYDQSAARILGFAVNGTGFDERTRTQMIASDASVEEIRERWGEFSDSEFDVAIRVGGWVAGADLQTLSEPDALVRTVELAVEDLMSGRYSPERVLGRVLSKPGIRVSDIGEALRLTGLYGQLQPSGYSRDSDATVRAAFIDRLRRAIGFTHPDTGYRPPDGWLLGNRDMRRDHAEKLREIVDRLNDDPGYMPLDAYREAQSHTVAMREKYNDSHATGSLGATDHPVGNVADDNADASDDPETLPPNEEDQAARLDADGAVVADLRTVRGDAAVNARAAHLVEAAGEDATFHGIAFEADIPATGSPRSTDLDEMLSILDALAQERRQRAGWARLCAVHPAELRSATAGLRHEFAELEQRLAPELARTGVMPSGARLTPSRVRRAVAAWESEQRRVPQGPSGAARHAELWNWRAAAERYRRLSHLFDRIRECERLDHQCVELLRRLADADDSPVAQREKLNRPGWVPVGEARALPPDNHPGVRDQSRRIAAAADQRRRSYRAAVRGAALIGVDHPDRLRVDQLVESVARLVDWSDEFRDSSNPHRSDDDLAHATHIVDVGAITLAYARVCRYAAADERAARIEAVRDIARELLEREIVEGHGGRFEAPGVAVVETESGPPEVFVAGPMAGLADALAAVAPDIQDDLSRRGAFFRYQQIVLDENGQVYVREVRPADAARDHPAQSEVPDRAGQVRREEETAATTSRPGDPAALEVDISDQQVHEAARIAVDQQLEEWRDQGLHGERLTDYVAFLPVGDGGTLVIAAAPGRHRRALLDVAATDPRFAGALWRPRFAKQYLAVVPGPDGPTAEQRPAFEAEGPYRVPTIAETEAILLDEYLRLRRLGLIESGFGSWLAGVGDHAFYNKKEARSAGLADAVPGRLKQDGTVQAFGLAVAEAESAVDPDLPHPTAVLVRAVTRQFPLPDRNLEDGRSSGAGIGLRTAVDLGGISMTVEFKDTGAGWRLVPPAERGHAGDVLSRWFRGMTDLDPNRLLRRIQQAVDAGGPPAADGTSSADPGRSVDLRTLWQMIISPERDLIVDIRRDGDGWRAVPVPGTDASARRSDMRDSDLTRLAWRVNQSVRKSDSIDADDISETIEIALSQDELDRYDDLVRAAEEAAAQVQSWTATEAALFDRLAADHPDLPDDAGPDAYERLASVLGEPVALDREVLADELGIDPLDLESIPLDGDPAARRADILRRESDLRALMDLPGQRASSAADMSRAVRARDGFLTGRVIAAALEGSSDGRQPTDAVGYLPDASGGLLIVAAPDGGHMRSLSELAATDPKFAGALWADDLAKRYLRVRLADGRIEAEVVAARAAEGPNRRHSDTEIRMQLLDHYLTYRTAGAIYFGFRTWLEQLGPQAFRTDKHRARGNDRSGLVSAQRKTPADSEYLLWHGSRMVRAGVDLPRFHPARVLHRLRTRQVPPLPPAPQRPGEQGTRLGNPVVTLGAMAARLSLEQHDGRWRLASGTGGQINDVLARHFPDLAAKSARRLVARIEALVADGAGPDMHHALLSEVPKTCFVAAAEAAAAGPGPRPRIDIPQDRVAGIRLAGVDGRDAARWAGANWHPGGFESPAAIVAHVRRSRGTIVGAVEYRSAGAEESGNIGAHAFTVKLDGDVVVLEDQVARLDADGAVVTNVRTVRGDAAVNAWAADLLEVAGEEATYHGIAFEEDGKPERRLSPDDQPVGLPGIEFPLAPMGERRVGRDPPEASFSEHRSAGPGDRSGPGEHDVSTPQTASGQWHMSEAERSLQGLGQGAEQRIPEGVNESFVVDFGAGRTGVYRPGTGEYRGMVEDDYEEVFLVPRSGLAVRVVATSRLDEKIADIASEFDPKLRSPQIPTTTLWSGSRGRGSLSMHVPDVGTARTFDELDRVQRDLLTVRGYILGERHLEDGNYGVTDDGDTLVVVTDGYCLPDSKFSFSTAQRELPGGSFTLYNPVDPVFVRRGAAGDEDRVHPVALAVVEALQPAWLDNMLDVLGIERSAIDGALDRLRELKAHGRVLGAAWPYSPEPIDSFELLPEHRATSSPTEGERRRAERVLPTREAYEMVPLDTDARAGGDIPRGSRRSFLLQVVDGTFIGPDGVRYTSPFLEKHGTREFVSLVMGPVAGDDFRVGWNHLIVYDDYPKSELGVPGYAVCTFVDGQPDDIESFANAFGHAVDERLGARTLDRSKAMRAAAQLRYELRQRGVDLSGDRFKGLYRGALWTASTAGPTVGDLIDRGADAAEELLPGFGADDFWVAIERLESESDRLTTTLSLNPVLFESGDVDVEWSRVAGEVSARITRVNLGQDPVRVAEALRELDGALRRWLAESDVELVGAAGSPAELAISASSAADPLVSAEEVGVWAIERLQADGWHDTALLESAAAVSSALAADSLGRNDLRIELQTFGGPGERIVLGRTVETNVEIPESARSAAMPEFMSNLMGTAHSFGVSELAAGRSVWFIFEDSAGHTQEEHRSTPVRSRHLGGALPADQSYTEPQTGLADGQFADGPEKSLPPEPAEPQSTPWSRSSTSALPWGSAPRPTRTTGPATTTPWSMGSSKNARSDSFPVPGADMERTALYGVDSERNEHAFRADQVQSKQLADVYGRPIGVSFPTRSGDIEHARMWARMRHRSSDTVFKPVLNLGSDDKPEWAYEPPVQAPWSTPLYAQAHAGKDQFIINVDLGGNPRKPLWTTVRVDGRTYGQLLVANLHFRRALRGAAPDGDLVLLSCNAAGPDGTAAGWAATYIHEAGISRKIRAFAGKDIRYFDKNQEWSELAIEILLDAAGNRLPPITTILPPSGPEKAAAQTNSSSTDPVDGAGDLADAPDSSLSGADPESTRADAAAGDDADGSATKRAARFIVTSGDNASVALDRSPDLMSLARTHADEVIRLNEVLGLRPQSVTSAVYNRLTGEVYFGVNNTHYVGDPPDRKIRMGAPKPLHSALGERMPAESLEEWPAANCAEVHGANKALLDASLPESLSIHRHTRPLTVSDLAYSTIRTMTGQPYPSCRNCQVLLGGAVEILRPGSQQGLFVGAGATEAAQLFPDPKTPD
ncbi:hypothetical protein ACFXNW_21835 [Nocardia sp. NPDC059180]|uniref:hypothetical protein n=1 Tax=Nocardia sp. NPDC059180 TaxID=3346761 RepID=UPI0036CC4724